MLFSKTGKSEELLEKIAIHGFKCFKQKKFFKNSGEDGGLSTSVQAAAPSSTWYAAHTVERSAFDVAWRRAFPASRMRSAHKHASSSQVIVMSSALDNLADIVGYPIDKPVLLINAPAPKSGKVFLQGFRLSYTSIASPLYIP